MPSTMANVKHLQANGGRALANLGQTISFKAEPEDTGDKLFLFEHRMPPTLGVPAHTEHNHEAFYVLEGELTIDIPGRGTFSAKRGDAFFLKANTNHTARNSGNSVLKLVAAQIK